MIKTIMTIDQYKHYKNGELSLLDIKLQNIGINKNKILTYLIKNKNYIMILIVLFSGDIASELYLDSQMNNISNAFNYNFDESVNLFGLNNNSSTGI